MKHFIVFVCAFLSFFTAFSQTELGSDCDVRQVSSRMAVDGSQLFYALPKNLIRIEVAVTKRTQFEGPYKEYSTKFLNIIEGVIQSDDEFFAIKNITFHRLSIPDSSKFYSVNYKGSEQFPLLQLNSDGVLLGCNVFEPIEGYSTLTCPLLQPETKTEDVIFTDLGVKPFLIETAQTLFKTVQTDSTPQRVSYEDSKKIATTKEQNAEQAAAFIFKLRKRKLKLLIGLKDEVNEVDGIAMKTMVDELKELEQSYLELFLGKTIEENYTYFFYFEPDEEANAEQEIVGWFSEKRGLSTAKPDVRRSDFKPLILTAESLGDIPKPVIQVMDKSQKTPVPIKYGLYYRIPGRVDLSLQYNDIVLGRQQWEIAQKGKTVPLPVEYLNSHKYAVELHPQTGALKRISINKVN